jgi:predicted alpha/beta-fold hydrolase
VSQCASNLNSAGLSKSLYGDRLLRSMKNRLHAQFDVVHDFPFDRKEIDKCESIMDFENLLIAPTFGFVDAWDYYDQCKTIDLLHTICVPHYIVQALDDPFFQGMVYPKNDPHCAVNIHFTQYGGHCGFVFQTENDSMSTTSWMPTQLARFLAHVDEQRSLGSEECQEATADVLVDTIA